MRIRWFRCFVMLSSSAEMAIQSSSISSLGGQTSAMDPLLCRASWVPSHTWSA